MTGKIKPFQITALFNARIFLLVCLLFVAVRGRSQDIVLPAISADRPGMATSPGIVLPHKFQIETGSGFEHLRNAASFHEQGMYNSSLFRFGINSFSEIRLQTDLVGIKTDSLQYAGFNPVTVGSKILLSGSKGILPDVSLLVNLTLPWFGEKHLKPSNFAPSLYLLMQNDLSAHFNLCYNFGMGWDGENAVPEQFAAICLTASVNQRFSGFIESYNYFARYQTPEFMADCGCAYLVRNNLQLDISAGTDFNNLRSYFIIDAGVSWRIPR